ncbi:MAG: hypothetical protein K5662_01990 [Lachnospiraceae bacterium]|nr:hypothetical protein [Lachnospiraceae bacterium]
MSFWNDVKDKVGVGSKAVAEKAKELSDIASLKAQIVSCESTINKGYKDLGRKYYEEHKNDEEYTYSEVMTLIRDAEVKKSELELKIKETKTEKVEASNVAKAPAQESASYSEVKTENTIDDTVQNIATAVSDAVDTAVEEVKDIVTDDAE